MPSSSSGPGYNPFKVDDRGSNPLDGANTTLSFNRRILDSESSDWGANPCGVAIVKEIY